MVQSLLLSHVSIVVTRPKRQSDPFCDKLRELGATPIAFPCIEIQPLTPPDNIGMQTLDFAIFTSPNAVEYGFHHFSKLGELAKSSKIAAVGPATAEALLSRGIENVLCSPTTADSEGLLEIPEFQALQGKSLLIIKGVAGRRYLRDCLEQRGANLTSVDVYERILPNHVEIACLGAKIDLILFTSSEIVENFLAITPKDLQKSLLNCQTIVGHPRIAEKVSSLGFKKLPIIATSPADREMLATIKLWAQKNGEK